MKLPPITAAELKSQLDAGANLRLVDVREHSEWISELGHIQGAELIPLGTLASKLDAFQGESREIISICKSGMRAAQAAELLARAGLNVRVLTGGTLAWKGAGFPTSREP